MKKKLWARITARTVEVFHEGVRMASHMRTSGNHKHSTQATFADAILDRIVHNAYRIDLDGASMRKTIAKKDDENPQT